MMRIDVEFPRPLSRAQRAQLLVAMSTLSKAQKVRFIKGYRAMVLMGEGIGIARVRDEITELGLTPERVESSLDPDIDAHCDDAAQDAANKERFRAIGR
jgi:hypothetical protein